MTSACTLATALVLLLPASAQGQRGQVAIPAERPRQQFGLVVAPFGQAVSVQRHRHNRIKGIAQAVPLRAQQRGGQVAAQRGRQRSSVHLGQRVVVQGRAVRALVYRRRLDMSATATDRQRRWFGQLRASWTD